MSIRSEHPLSVGQIYRALIALDSEPLFDPEVRPEGPLDEDPRQLLGALLATAELEIAAATRPDRDEDEADVLLGWTEAVGPGSALTGNLLVGRLLRTGVQLLGLDGDETLPGEPAASMAVAVAADTYGARLRLQDSDVEGVRQALGRAEAALIEVQRGMHELRVAIGDAQEE